MRCLFSRNLSAVAAVCLVWFAAMPRQAVAKKLRKLEPIAVLSVSSYQRLQDDFASVPILASLVKQYLPADFRQLGSLKGLDPTRPLGAVIVTDGLAIVPIVLIPIQWVVDSAKSKEETASNLERLLESLKPILGKYERLDGQGGAVWKVGEKVTGFVRQHGDWAYLAQSEKDLERLPKPGEVLGEVLGDLKDKDKRFDAAFRFNFEHVPDVFRTMAVDVLRASMKRNLPRQAGESEAAHALRRQSAIWQFRTYEHLLTGSRQVTLGWSLDKEKTAVLDLHLVPEPESTLARQVATLTKTTTRFGRLGGDRSLLSMHAKWRLGKRQIDLVAEDIVAARPSILTRIGETAWVKDSSAENKVTIGEVAGTVIDLIDRTVRTGHVDFAMAVNRSVGTDANGLVTIVAAAHVGGGASLRAAFESIAGLGKSDARFAGLKTNVAEIDGRPIHAVLLPSGDRKAAGALLGEALNLYILTTEDSLLMAIGPDALATLRRATTRSEAKVSPLQANLQTRNLLDVVLRMNDPGALVRQVILAGLAGGNDRIDLTVHAEPAADGQFHLRARLVAHDAAIRVISAGTAFLLNR